METQNNEVEQNYNACAICQNNNYYVRQKIFPCKNEDCDQHFARRNDICNQCIRNIQRSVVLCPFCNKAQLQINSFGQYRNPFIKKFNIGLFSTKYLATKATKLEEAKVVPIGSFNILPVIAFNIINLSDQNKEKSIKTKGKMLLSHDRNVQALEVMTENPSSSSNSNLTQKEQTELQTTKYCLEDLFRTCRSHLVRCGTNQILVSGGYIKDIDFLYGLTNSEGKFIAFQDRLQDIWKNYQEGLFEQEQLIEGVQQILREYTEIQIKKGKMPADCQLPFYYPYQNTNFLINLNAQENSDFSVLPQPYLYQNRAYHQTIVTEDRIFAIGGLCNGFVLDSIESATIQRDIASKIISISEFSEISNMVQPRARFSAVYKSAVACTEKNCVSFKTKQKGISCTNTNCANHQYIYIAGGQHAYGKVPDTLTIERYNFSTNSCQTINLSYTDKSTSIINQFNGMTLGVWKNDVFLFGGVPKSEQTYKNNPQSYFVLLKPGVVIGFETIMSVEFVSNSMNHCYQPEFTVSIPFQSQNEEEKEISEDYRSFIVHHRRGDNFYFDNYRIARNDKQEIKLSKCMQSENKSFQFVDKQWIEQGFFEEQNYCLLNSYIDY